MIGLRALCVSYGAERRKTLQSDLRGKDILGRLFHSLRGSHEAAEPSARMRSAQKGKHGVKDQNTQTSYG